MKMSRFSKSALSAIAAVSLIVGIPGSAQAGLSVPADTPNVGLYMVENFQLGSMPSQLFAAVIPSDATTYLMCKSAEDARCVAARIVFGIGGLDVCTDSIKMSCIQDVWAVDPSNKKIPGEFVKDVQRLETQQFDEIPSIKMQGSHSLGAIWRIPGVVNSAGTEEYFVAAEDRLWATKNPNSPLSSARVDPENFNAGIVPIKSIAGKYAVLKASDYETGNGAWGSRPEGEVKTPDGQQCVITDATFCGLRAQFPEGYRFGMSLRIGNLPTGWFAGRLGLPLITTSKKDGVDVLSIEATPLQVPSLDFVVPNAEIPAEARKMIFDGSQWGRGGTKSWQLLSDPSDPRMMALLVAMAPAYKNTATKTDSTWSFKTMVGNNDSRDVINRCSSTIGTFGGLVTSNAITYSDGAPAYDASTGALTYKVASPHYRENGKVALGTYDLAIRSNVVRCIYNFSNAPIQATISILSEDGENQVATTVVNERNGWLYLSAKGYTFSSPTISVKLSQSAAAEATPSPTATSAAKANAKKTITCTKGKVVKKVTGAKPVCPKGYSRTA